MKTTSIAWSRTLPNLTIGLIDNTKRCVMYQPIIAAFDVAIMVLSEGAELFLHRPLPVYHRAYADAMRLEHPERLVRVLVGLSLLDVLN